jgi:uncharacterized membrane protein YjgN (DUF898 family)
LTTTSTTSTPGSPELPFSPAPHSPDVIHRERMMFGGTGSEYFRIWIVNILLTVLTLGIFSAWAKVRRTQYFYRNTRVAGAGFDYHGDPLAILKGRIIAAVLFGSYYAAGLVSPLLGGIAFVILVAVLPWLICRSLRFRFQNTSYRGLRFRFTGSTADAYKTFLLLPIATFLTFGAFAPMWHHRVKHYLHSNAWYGQTRFSFDATVGGFYRIYLAALGLLLALIAGGAALAVPFMISGLLDPGAMTGAVMLMLAGLAVIAYATASVSMWAFITARVQNLAWNHTTLGPHRLLSSIEVRPLVWLTMTNLLGMLLTLGLFKPFAEVRVTAYLLSASSVVTSGNLNDFVAGEQFQIDAAGEEAVEMFDIDLAI